MQAGIQSCWSRTLLPTAVDGANLPIKVWKGVHRSRLKVLRIDLLSERVINLLPFGWLLRQAPQHTLEPPSTKRAFYVVIPLWAVNVW